MATDERDGSVPAARGRSLLRGRGTMHGLILSTREGSRIRRLPGRDQRRNRRRRLSRARIRPVQHGVQIPHLHLRKPPLLRLNGHVRLQHPSKSHRRILHRSGTPPWIHFYSYYQGR